MKLSLIIPVYNEAAHLADFLDFIDGIKLPIEKELVIVDDASLDGSAEILRTFRFKSPCQVLLHKKNRGKGSAVQTGLAVASGDFIAIQDADMEYDPHEIPALLSPLIAETADFVFGSRFTTGRVAGQPAIHYLANKSLTMISNFFTGFNLSDMETCYKLMRADLAGNIVLRSRRFGLEPEITAKIARLNVRLAELPVSYRPRTYKGGKKIGWLDGLAALWHIAWYNLFARRSSWIKPGLPARYLSKKR